MKKFLCFLLALVCIVPTVALTACSDDLDDAERVANRVYYVQSSKEDLTNTTDNYKDGTLKLYFYNSTFKVEYTNSENAELNGYYTGTYDTDDDVVKLKIEDRYGYFLTGALSFDTRKLTFTTLKYYNKTLEFEDIIDGKLIQFTFSEVELN